MPTAKKKILKIKKPRRKKIDLYDTDHPFRRAAIDIIKAVIEPILQRGINGKQYYHLEDSITIAINRRLKTLIKIPLKLDNRETFDIKVLKDDSIDESDVDTEDTIDQDDEEFN